MVSKACKPLNVLQSLKFSLQRKTLEQIYISYIRPLVENGSQVWGNCTISEERLIENVQLAAARIVTGAIRTVSHRALYLETGWETLASRREKQKLILFQKIIHNHTPPYLKNHLPCTVGARSQRSLRNSEDISIIRANKDYFANSFFPSAIKLWNNLEPGIRQIQDTKHFKSEINKNITKIPHHLSHGLRKANIIMTRLRMGCSELNSDLFKIGVVNTQICVCGHGPETSYHFFFVCQKYMLMRTELHSKIIHLSSFNAQALHLKKVLCGSCRCTAVFHCL